MNFAIEQGARGAALRVDPSWRSPGHRPRTRPCGAPTLGQSPLRPLSTALLALTAAAVFLVGVAPLGAQQPTAPAGTVTLTGVVRDATTGEPLRAAFLSVGDRGPRTISDAQGRFRLVGVPTGTHDVAVQLFGYRDLELRVVVTDAPQPLEVRLEPDAVAIDGITVSGGAQVALSGVVRDAETLAPLPWVSLWLRDVRRAAGDGQGVFRIPRVQTGSYLLLVEKLGYTSQYFAVDVTAPPTPLDITLQPDSALMAGLARMEQQLERRRRSAPSVVRSFGEDQLRLSAAAGMRRFLENDAALNFFPCGARDATNDCRDIRGNLVAPRVYIDDLEAFGGLNQLGSYEPWELHAVDVFTCGPGDRRGGWEIRVYTFAYMERQARRGRAVLPSCF